ncbi:hypothetical protein FRX31_026675 [Thalictrum thalictroides]|uniref:Zinc knuckle (CCHC-type) family protein n=1 Tax=Thalictrum thalictroides TaxID=46969 RepID=A0A7J6VHP0_THATH|nr:hypothetical protein FRX31_026675 [Thalictrum thalictroides]
MGYYASVQVDVDLAKTILDKILVEIEGKNMEFWQEVEVGRIPKFCNNCKIVGHLTECRHLAIAKGKEVSKEGTDNKKNEEPAKELSKSQRKQWRKKQKEANGGEGTSDVNKSTNTILVEESQESEVVEVIPTAIENVNLETEVENVVVTRGKFK